MKLLKILTILCCFAICGCPDEHQPVGGPPPMEMGSDMEVEMRGMSDAPADESPDEPPAEDDMGDKSNEFPIPKENEAPS